MQGGNDYLGQNDFIMGVCSIHFEDKALIKFIDDNVDSEYCDYCEEEKPSINFDRFQDFVEEAVYSEYCEPYEEGAPYNSEENYYEDRFPGITVQHTSELIDELLNTFDYEIVEDLASSFPDDYLTLREAIWGPTKNEYFLGGWDKFKQIIKYEVRFLFFDAKLTELYEDEFHESLNPAFVLDEVGKAILELGFITRIPVGELSLYRARQHKLTEAVNNAETLGSPPQRYAKANRMSPAGISMFYGALDVDTCRSEVIDENWKDSMLTVGEFVNIKEFNLIDFTDVGEIPSLFDEKNRVKRSIMGFVKSFVADLSIPVQPDDTVHIEYVPTQVVTEYLKLKFLQEHNVHGILYRSVKNNGGLCAVLFTDNQHMLSSTEIAHANKNHIMALVEDSIFTELIL